MDEREILYVSNADSEEVGVIVPMAYWREIEPTYRAVFMWNSGAAEQSEAGDLPPNVDVTKSPIDDI